MMRSTLAASALACLVLVAAASAATHEAAVRRSRGATRNRDPSGTLTATVYPKNIVQGSDAQRYEGCSAHVKKSTCCKTPEQSCCSKPCYQTPEYKPEVADSVAPELKEKNCQSHDTTRCCSATVQSCCQACPRFAEATAEASTEYQSGRFVSPLIDCPGHRRSRSCCSTETEHLTTCCTPRKECQSTRIGDMKMGALKVCPEEERTRCCERVSDSCCKPCGSQRRRILIDADLAPLNSVDDECPKVRVRRCCTSSVQRCCSQCESPVMSGFLEYGAAAPSPAPSTAAAKASRFAQYGGAVGAAPTGKGDGGKSFLEYGAATTVPTAASTTTTTTTTTAAPAPTTKSTAAAASSLSRFAEYQGAGTTVAAASAALNKGTTASDYQGGVSGSGVGGAARLSGAAPLSAIARKAPVPSSQKRAYQNSLTPVEYDNDEEYVDS